MNKDILNMLVCPVCRGRLTLTDDNKCLRCESGHNFDIAKSGYVNFCGSQGGDSKECVAARREFLALGYYKTFADEILSLLDSYVPSGRIADAGCGEGYYGDIFAKSGHPLCGFDLSRSAVEAAAKKKNPDAFFAVGGIYDLPLADGSADAVTNIFAPCAEKEFTRVLRDGGVLIVAGAGPDHLMGLKTALYDIPEPNTPRADLPVSLEHTDSRRVKYDINLKNPTEIASLFAMTPYYYRTSPDAAARLAALTSLTTTVDFLIEVYKK